MDYHSIHGHDISSFDIPDTHRLPTVQASQALNDLQDDDSLYISTGLKGLDKALLSFSTTDSQNSSPQGGIKRSQVTEIWGPPGTGRTAIAIELATHSLRNKDNVVWIDCFQELQVSRLEKVLHKSESSAVTGMEDEERARVSFGKFIHFSCLTLPHLMTLISRPNSKAIPEQVGLVVISSISALINSSLPKAVEETSSSKMNKGQSATIKRRQGLQFIINALQRLAATKNCAVVVLSQCATRMHSEHGATLLPAVNASAWDQGISTRLVMFRDWTRQNNKLQSLFLAGLQKVDGKPSYDAIDSVAAFRLNSTGVTDVEYDTTNIHVESAAAIPHKRSLDQTDLEVPDSEDDEDYGWAEEDEGTLPQPPQWQGSEDLLLGQELGHSDEEREDDGGSIRSILSEATD